MYGICVRMGISPGYFLDEMEGFELKAIINESDNVFKANCEDIRKIQHAIFQSQSTKALDLTDIQRFPWDESEIVTPVKTDQEREAYALEMLNILNKT